MELSWEEDRKAALEVWDRRGPLSRATTPTPAPPTASKSPFPSFSKPSRDPMEENKLNKVPGPEEKEFNSMGYCMKWGFKRDWIWRASKYGVYIGERMGTPATVVSKPASTWSLLLTSASDRGSEDAAVALTRDNKNQSEDGSAMEAQATAKEFGAESREDGEMEHDEIIDKMNMASQTRCQERVEVVSEEVTKLAHELSKISNPFTEFEADLLTTTTKLSSSVDIMAKKLHDLVGALQLRSVPMNMSAKEAEEFKQDLAERRKEAQEKASPAKHHKKTLTLERAPVVDDKKPVRGWNYDAFQEKRKEDQKEAGLPSFEELVAMDGMDGIDPMAKMVDDRTLAENSKTEWKLRCREAIELVALLPTEYRELCPNLFVGPYPTPFVCPISGCKLKHVCFAFQKCSPAGKTCDRGTLFPSVRYPCPWAIKDKDCASMVPDLEREKHLQAMSHNGDSDWEVFLIMRDLVEYHNVGAYGCDPAPGLP